MPDMSRLACLLLTALVAAGAVQSADMRPDYDVVIRNGRVLDGSGNPWMLGDVAISGGRIVMIGRLPDGVGATRVIDAAGLTVAPGFIDVHSHAVDGLVGSLPDGVPLLAEGVTTVFINPDGDGAIDLPAQRALLARAGVGVNVGQFVPQGAIRRAVLGMSSRAPSVVELDKMAALVRSGMEAGGLGLSTGLYYAPGSFATTEEVIALARVAGEYGGVYASHIRDEADYTVGVVAAVDEVIRIADEARLPGIVSHMKALGPTNWGKGETLTRHLDEARARGVQLFADQYPYEASGTTLVAALVPRWAEEGGRDALVSRLRGADRARIRAAISENIVRRGGAATLVVSDFAPDHSLEGRSLADLAAAAHQPVEDFVIDLVVRSDGGLVSFNMSEDDIRHIMRQPYTMTCSDGELTAPGQGKPHPRGYGAFARKLAVYVRERHVLSLEEAVRSMTSLPALVFGLKDRGVLRRGARADVVVFDPSTIRDEATYAEPQRLATGVRYVLVNGVVEIDDTRPTQQKAGQFVRPER
jgi:N-acyl-D-amino-acid deacylase